MKKTLVALAALAAAGASFAQTTTGQPGFQITGGFCGGLVSIDYKGNKVTGFDQNGICTSQLMFRGTEDLGGGMQAFFLHDTDVQFMTTRGDQGTAPGAGNTGTASSWGSDQKYIGLKGSFGDVRVGAINNFALYNYVIMLAPYAGTAYAGGYAIITASDPTMSGVRWDNEIQYKTPTMGGFTGGLTYAFKQPINTAGAATAYSPAVGVFPNTGSATAAGALELMGNYKAGALEVGLTYQKVDNTQTLATGAGAGYVAGMTALAAGYQVTPAIKLAGGMQRTYKSGTGNVGDNVQERSSYLLSGIYTSGANIVWASYGNLKEDAAGAAKAVKGESTTMLGLGYRRDLSKMTNFQVRYERADDKAGIIAQPGGGLPAEAGNTVRTRTTASLAVNF